MTNPLANSYAQQFMELREEMLGERVREILGPLVSPCDLQDRLEAHYFPDGEFQVLLDGNPILQVKGPCLENQMACIWRTANFRTA